ncbi:MAG: glycosyltransferase family 9 protein [Desulfamplus sp.]|nr:glycosyltransferase family 9 protein [Desulfamplus sp.]
MQHFKRIKDFFLTYFMIVFDRMAVCCSKKIKSSSPKLLLVRVDYIGDFIIWLDTAKYFRQQYPYHYITLVVYEPCATLAKYFPYWDEIWSLNLKKFKYNLIYRFNFLRRVKKAGFDVAIHPIHSRSFFCGDSIIRASVASERIGSEGDYSNITRYRKKISDQWYTRLVSLDSPIEIKRNSDFINRLFNLSSQPQMFNLPTLLNLGKKMKFQQPYYALFPGASSIYRRWTIENFIQIADIIYKKTGWHGIVCGGKDEIALCQKIATNTYSPIMNIAGKTTIVELIEIIRDSAIFVGNETSGIHIATATHTPSVCILGGGQPGRFLPYVLEEKDNKILPIPVIHSMPCFGCDWRCKHPIRKGRPFPCIEQITVQDVIKVVDELLEKR